MRIARVGVAIVIIAGAGSFVGCTGDTTSTDSVMETSVVSPSAPTSAPVDPSDAPELASVKPLAPGPAVQAACAQLNDLPDWNRITQLEPITPDPFYAQELLFWSESSAEEYVDILGGLRNSDAEQDLRGVSLIREIENRQRAAEVLSGDARYFLEAPTQDRYRILLMGYGGSYDPSSWIPMNVPR